MTERTDAWVCCWVGGWMEGWIDGVKFEGIKPGTHTK